MFWCTECFLSCPLCKSCILSSHMQLPFHTIQMWSGTHFIQTSLSILGAIVYLGHHSHPCPNNSILKKGQSTVIVHTNGIHQIRIEYCCCAGAPEDFIQLTRSELFPASPQQPETVFTFSLLRNFHVHTHTSKKSALDYYEATVRHTKKVFPQSVPVSFVFLICTIIECSVNYNSDTIP